MVQERNNNTKPNVPVFNSIHNLYYEIKCLNYAELSFYIHFINNINTDLQASSAPHYILRYPKDLANLKIMNFLYLPILVYLTVIISSCLSKTQSGFKPITKDEAASYSAGKKKLIHYLILAFFSSIWVIAMFGLF